MGAKASRSSSSFTGSSASVDASAVTTSATPVDNILWIASSLKNVVPYLQLESVLCLHNVSKLLAWHVHNLGTWRLLCLRDFPSARSLFHDRILLRRATTASPMCGGRERLSGRGYFFLEGRLQIRLMGCLYSCI